MIRSVVAVVGAYVVLTVAILVATIAATRLILGGSMFDPSLKPTTTYLAVNLTCSVASAVLAGYVAALIARRRPIAHATVLAAIMLLMGVVSLRNPSAGQPGWYLFAIALGGPVFAICGGALRARHAALQTA